RGLAVRPDLRTVQADRRGAPRRDGPPEPQVRRGCRAGRPGPVAETVSEDAGFHMGAREVRGGRVDSQAQRPCGAIDDIRRAARALAGPPASQSVLGDRVNMLTTSGTAGRHAALACRKHVTEPLSVPAGSPVLHLLSLTSPENSYNMTII